MPLAHSKITAKGQIVVPAEVCQKLGTGPGSILAWEEKEGQIVVRRAAGFSSQDVRKALFPRTCPTPRSLEDLKKGIRKYVRDRYARG
jgi:AbrB family looped-hinge helix DNA binding protein